MWQTLLAVAILTIGVLSLSVAAKTFPKKPLLATFFSLTQFPIVFGVLTFLDQSGGPKPRLYLTAMFVLVGLLATVTKRVKSVPKYFSDWRSWYLVLAIL